MPIDPDPANRAERDRWIWRQHIAGHSQPAIARMLIDRQPELGFTPLTVKRISQVVAQMRGFVPRATKEELTEDIRDVLAELRASAVDLARRPLPPAFSGGELLKDDDGTPIEDAGPRMQALRAALAVIESERKLLGLDRAQEIDVTAHVRYEIVGADPAALQ